jgi:phosphoribosylamine--glycine ligase
VRVLIIDTDHVSLDLAMRAAAADHEVRVFRYSKKPTNYAIGFGSLFTLVDDWRPHMAWAKDGLIINTANNRYLWELDRYRQDFGYGNSIFAPTVASARLEIERSAGMEVMEAIGLDLPEYHVFTSLEEAEAFARKASEPFVVKPTGDEERKDLTYVASDPADLVGWLRRHIKSGTKIAGKIMLQKKIERLAEYGVSGWCGPEGFLPDRWSTCFEHKPLMSNDIGPATGEMGSVLQYADTDKLADEMLKPLEPTLRALGHRGDFAVNAMIDTKGKAWFLEFTARFGYPAAWIQAASHKGDPVKWMKSLLTGKDDLKVSYDTAIGVVMARPDFPHDALPPGSYDGIPLQGADAVIDDLHLVEVMRGKGPVWEGGKIVERPTYETAGTYIAVATALGKTVAQAREKVYKTVKAVKWPDKIYRDDIGEKVIDKLKDMHRFGYALDMEA